MTERSIQAGAAPTVVVKAGVSVTIKGVDGERVTAQTSGRWGLQVKARKETIEVQMGGSGEVLVPAGASVKVYAGKNAEIVGIHGTVVAVAGLNLSVKGACRLGQASAGGAMSIDCRALEAQDVTFNAGSDLSFHVQELASARIRVNDIGGYWEARMDSGEVSVFLKSGGDVTLVTDQPVQALPPHYVLGRIEKPA